MKKLGVFCVVLLATVALFGCSKKSPTATTVVQGRMIFASFSHYTGGGSAPYYYKDVSIYTDPTPDSAKCSAQMNFGSTQFQLQRKWQYIGEVDLSDTLPFPFPSACSLFVTTNLGTAKGGGVSSPGSFDITWPLERDTLPWGNLTVSWTQAQNASWYEFNLYYSAYDTTHWLGSGDTTLYPTGTSVTLPQAFFQRYPSATYVSVSIWAGAYSGPAPGAGTSGNVSGDFKGFLVGEGHDHDRNDRYFYMGTPRLAPGLAHQPPEIDAATRRQRLLRAYGLPALRSGT